MSVRRIQEPAVLLQGQLLPRVSGTVLQKVWLPFCLQVLSDGLLPGPLLNGGGFDGPEWSVRASLANLNENDYATIGQGLKRILDEYAEEWKKIKN